MLRIGLAAVLFSLLSAAVAFADSAPGDDTADFTCEQFCARAASCGTACFTTSCTAYCNSHTVLYCTDYYNCSQFNSCACPGIADDDAADDDDTGDDGSPGAAGDDGADRRHGCGCVVARDGGDWALPALMALAGLAALRMAARRKRRP